MLLEAALAATAPAERAAFYQQVQPTCAQALQYCFPQLGPGGNLKKSKLPPTPPVDDQSSHALREAVAAHQRQAQAAIDKGERPVEWMQTPALFAEPPAAAPQLSPKTREATVSDTTAAAATTSVAPVSPPTSDPDSPAAQLSPKKEEATADDSTPSGAASDTPSDSTTVTEEPAVAIDYNLPIDFKLSHEDFTQAIAALDPQEQRILRDQRIRYWTAVKQRRQEREAAKRQKAAKKRAEAQRRRAA